MSLVDRAGPVTGTPFRLGFIWEISLRFPRWEKAKDPGKEFWGQIRETKQTWRKTKILTLAIIASATLKAVLYYCRQMQCLWCLWKYSRQCKTMLSRPPQLLALFRPCNRAEVFIWQNFQPTNRDLGNRASPPFHMNTSKILRRILRYGEISETGSARSTGVIRVIRVNRGHVKRR